MRIAGLTVALLVAVGLLIWVWDGDEAWRTCSGSIADGASEVAEVEAPASVSTEDVLELDQAVGAAFHPADGRLFAITQDGRVVTGGQTVIDLAGQVSSGYEQGLLGIAISPDGSTLVLDYTDLDGTTRIVSHALTRKEATFEVSPATELMAIEQPGHTHNGGHVTFGPDGLLYIGTGDGTSGTYTPELPGNGAVARDPGSPLGKILRVEVVDDGKIRIPAGNPFADGPVPEIYVMGMRNPWRFSFDRATGDLWVGDVGQQCFEEVTLVKAEAIAGANLGWDAYEGAHRFAGEPLTDHVLPAFEYGHDTGRCSVVGGFVYRGSAMPDLNGSYLFGDSCSGEVIALVPGGSGDWGVATLAPRIPTLVAFAEDLDGELYVVSLTAGVSRLVPAP